MGLKPKPLRLSPSLETLVIVELGTSIVACRLAFMASRRCLSALSRYGLLSPLSSNSKSVHHNLARFSRFNLHLIQLLSPHPDESRFGPPFFSWRSFSSRSRHPTDPAVIYEGEDGHEEVDESEEDEEEEGEYEDHEEGGNVSSTVADRAYSAEEKIQEAAEIGYKVVGPLQPSDRVFKPYEPVFAVVQIGSHQFKVSNGDVIYTEKLKFCDVNDKLILNKVMLLGSQNQTIIGRPILPDAAVHTVVEEHALDAKVIIFKKKRRKNYRRTKGHRQELTRLRITDIQGIEKPEMPSIVKNIKNVSSKKSENLAVAT